MRRWDHTGSDPQVTSRSRMLIVMAILAAAVVLLPMIPAFHMWLVADDSYYYYAIARNIVRDGNITFDASNRASGFHPLFMLMCTLLYGLSGEALPYIVPLLSVMGFGCHAAVCISIARLLKLHGTDAFVFGCMLIANPAVLVSGWCIGLETCVAIPLLTMFLYLCLKAVIEEPQAADFRLASWMVSLLFLARLDTLIFSFPTLLFAYKRLLRRHVVYVVLPLSVLGVFVGVHLCIFGTPVPASADAIRHLARPLFEQQHILWLKTGYYLDAPTHWTRFVINTFKSLKYATGIMSWGGDNISGNRIFFAIYFVLLLRGMFSGTFHGRLPFPPRVIAFSAFAMGCLVLLIYAGTVRAFYLRDWYHAMYAVVIGTLLWTTASAFGTRRGISRVHGVVHGLVVLAASLLAIVSAEPYPLARREVAAHAVKLSNGHRIAAFNAGIYGWAMPGKIVNVDGLANQEAYAAIRIGSLSSYLASAKLDYLLDVEPKETLAAYLGKNPSRLIPLKSWPDGPYVHTLYAIGVVERDSMER